MSIIYLATKYTGEEEEAFIRANKTMANLIQWGHAVISPISMYHTMAVVHNVPGDYPYWEKVNKKLMTMCNELMVITSPGWETSQGIQDEIEFAKSLGIHPHWVLPVI